jgi:Uma2 family endonuclease
MQSPVWRIISEAQPAQGRNPWYVDGMNVAWTRAAEGLPRRAFTAHDVRRMIEAGIIAEDERIELVEGELVVLAAKGYAHELVRLALTERLSDARPEGIRVAAEPTLQFADNSILEPDIAVFPRAAFKQSDSRFVRIDGGELLLVVEIGVSSFREHKRRKAPLYGRHGVRELWVVDANERIAWVHTGPTADGWSSIVEVGPQDVLSTPAMPGLTIKLGELE